MRSCLAHPANKILMKKLTKIQDKKSISNLRKINRALTHWHYKYVRLRQQS